MLALDQDQFQPNLILNKMCDTIKENELDVAKLWLQAQIYTGDPRTCAIFIPVWGSNWWYSGFPCD